MDWFIFGTFIVELIGLGFLVESRLRSARRAGRKSVRLVLPDSPYYDRRRGIDTNRYGNRAWEIRWLLRAGTTGLLLMVVSLTAFWTELLLTFPYNNFLTGEVAILISPIFSVACIGIEVAGVALMWFSAHAMTSKGRIHILADIAVLAGYERQDEEEEQDEAAKPKKGGRADVSPTYT